MLLINIADELKGIQTFWTTPHTPHAAALMIHTMENYEERLCVAITDGAPDEQSIAKNAYQELIPLLRNRMYWIDECSAPVEVASGNYCDDS